MLKLIKYILLFIFIFIGTTSFSQSKKQLQKEKERIEQDIKQTNKILQKTKNQKSSSLQHLKLLNTQVKNKENLLKNLDSEINWTDYHINKTIKSIEEIEITIVASLKGTDRRVNNLVFIECLELLGRTVFRRIFIEITQLPKWN